jgi:hypothetical protein
MLQVACAVAYLHCRNLLHGDIKVRAHLSMVPTRTAPVFYPFRNHCPQGAPRRPTWAAGAAPTASLWSHTPAPAPPSRPRTAITHTDGERAHENGPGAPHGLCVQGVRAPGVGTASGGETAAAVCSAPRPAALCPTRVRLGDLPKAADSHVSHVLLLPRSPAVGRLWAEQAARRRVSEGQSQGLPGCLDCKHSRTHIGDSNHVKASDQNVCHPDALSGAPHRQPAALNSAAALRAPQELGAQPERLRNRDAPRAGDDVSRHAGASTLPAAHGPLHSRLGIHVTRLHRHTVAPARRSGSPLAWPSSAIRSRRSGDPGRRRLRFWRADVGGA